MTKSISSHTMCSIVMDKNNIEVSHDSDECMYNHREKIVTDHGTTKRNNDEKV